MWRLERMRRRASCPPMLLPSLSSLLVSILIPIILPFGYGQEFHTTLDPTEIIPPTATMYESSVLTSSPTSTPIPQTTSMIASSSTPVNTPVATSTLTDTSTVLSTMTSSVQSTIPVVTSSAFVGPTIEPPPTLPPGPSYFHWNISDKDDKMCVIMQGSNLSVSFQDPRLGDKWITKFVGGLNAIYGPANVYGNCGDNIAVMNISWKNSTFESSFNMTFVFKSDPEEGTWEARSFLHVFDNLTRFMYEDQNYFKSPIGTAFYCERRITHSLKDEGRIVFEDFTVQAFPFFNQLSKDINHCAAPDKANHSKDVAMIVSVTVGSVIVVAVLGILLARSSFCQSEYDRLK